MLRNLTTILRLEKLCPLSAKNGHAGVDLAKKHKPDLILCDVMMPGLDGYGVIAALRSATAVATLRKAPVTAVASIFCTLFRARFAFHHTHASRCWSCNLPEVLLLSQIAVLQRVERLSSASSMP